MVVRVILLKQRRYTWKSTGENIYVFWLVEGASFFYHPGPVSYEAQEVRAFGLMLADLVERLQPDEVGSEGADLLASIRDECLSSPWSLRPSFAAVQARLD